MPDNEFLVYVGKQLKFIASECFDLKAAERLRKLERVVSDSLAAPPMVLSKASDRDEMTGR